VGPPSYLSRAFEGHASSVQGEVSTKAQGINKKGGAWPPTRFDAVSVSWNETTDCENGVFSHGFCSMAGLGIGILQLAMITVHKSEGVHDYSNLIRPSEASTWLIANVPLI
jgi:hypothetical protein